MASSPDALLNPRVVSGNVRGTEPTNLVHYGGLDGLRTLAFAMVFLAHFYAVPWGFGGVNFFFVLSGFLITGILWDGRDAPQPARTFYIRRALRIFPLYYGVLLVFLLSTPVFRWHWSRAWIAWPFYLGNFLRLGWHGVADPFAAPQAFGILQSGRFFQRMIFFGHFWSLCVEEQFYLIWPWVVFAIRSRRTLLKICLLAVVACPLLRALAQNSMPAWFTNREIVYVTGVPFQLDALLLGAALALVWRGPGRETLQRTAKMLLPCLGLLLAAYLLWIFHTVPVPVRYNYRYPAGRLTWGLSLLDLAGAVLLVRALDPGSVVYKLFALRPVRAVGKITYGAYVYHELLHEPCAHLVHTLTAYSTWIRNHDQGVATLYAAACTLLVSALSFRFVEAPFLRLKDRWAPSQRDVSQTDRAVAT